MLTKQQLKKLDKYDWQLKKNTLLKKSIYFFFVYPKINDKNVIFTKVIEAETAQKMADKIKSWIKTL